MVPEYLGGVYRQEQIRIDLSALAAKAGVQHIRERAVGLDPEAQAVALANNDFASYDVAAVDVGGVNPNRPDGAIPTKPITSVEPLADRLQAALHTSGGALHVAIVGGGAAGVEIALNVLGRVHAAGRLLNFDLTLVEASDVLLPQFPRGLQQYATRRLQARGAQIRRSTRVTQLVDGVLHTDRGTPLNPDAVLWATGSVGPQVLRTSGLPTDDRGFLSVDETLRSPAAPRVFAGGDCATVRGMEHLAKVGVHAVKQGAVLRANLDRTLLHLANQGTPPPPSVLRPFRPYPAAPLILSTGTPEGLWTDGTRWTHGTPLLRLKHWIDRRWIRPFAPAWRHASWVDLQRPDAPSVWNKSLTSAPNLTTRSDVS
jgi:selenide,water dikinase